MPFKSKKQEQYLRLNEPEVYRDWKNKYGSYKEAESFEAEKLHPGLYRYKGKIGLRKGWTECQSCDDLVKLNDINWHYIKNYGQATVCDSCVGKYNYKKDRLSKGGRHGELAILQFMEQDKKGAETFDTETYDEWVKSGLPYYISNPNPRKKGERNYNHHAKGEGKIVFHKTMIVKDAYDGEEHEHDVVIVEDIGKGKKSTYTVGTLDTPYQSKGYSTPDGALKLFTQGTFNSLKEAKDYISRGEKLGDCEHDNGFKLVDPDSTFYDSHDTYDFECVDCGITALGDVEPNFRYFGESNEKYLDLSAESFSAPYPRKTGDYYNRCNDCDGDILEDQYQRETTYTRHYCVDSDRGKSTCGMDEEWEDTEESYAESYSADECNDCGTMMAISPCCETSYCPTEDFDCDCEKHYDPTGHDYPETDMETGERYGNWEWSDDFWYQPKNAKSFAAYDGDIFTDPDYYTLYYGAKDTDGKIHLSDYADKYRMMFGRYTQDTQIFPQETMCGIKDSKKLTHFGGKTRWNPKRAVKALKKESNVCTKCLSHAEKQLWKWDAESFSAEKLTCKGVKAFVEYTCAKCGAERGLYEVEDGNFYRFDPDIGDCECGGFDVHSNEFITCRECDDYFHHRGDRWAEHLRIIMNRNDAESFNADSEATATMKSALYSLTAVGVGVIIFNKYVKDKLPNKRDE